jgi:hypothetical protein
MPLRAAWRALLALTCLAGTLGAQDEFEIPQKQLSLVIGGSIGSAGIACTPKCSADRPTGLSYLVRGTGQLNTNISLTLETSSFSKDVDTPNGKGHWTLTWYMLGAVWHPSDEEDFFINAGLGLGVAQTHLTFPATGAWAMNYSQVGGVVGVGRDLRLTDNFALTAFAQYYIIGKSQALIGRANSGAKVKTDIISAGLALTIF